MCQERHEQLSKKEEEAKREVSSLKFKAKDKQMMIKEKYNCLKELLSESSRIV